MDALKVYFTGRQFITKGLGQKGQAPSASSLSPSARLVPDKSTVPYEVETKQQNENELVLGQTDTKM